MPKLYTQNFCRSHCLSPRLGYSVRKSWSGFLFLSQSINLGEHLKLVSRKRKLSLTRRVTSDCYWGTLASTLTVRGPSSSACSSAAPGWPALKEIPAPDHIFFIFMFCKNQISAVTHLTAKVPGSWWWVNCEVSDPQASAPLRELESGEVVDQTDPSPVLSIFFHT